MTTQVVQRLSGSIGSLLRIIMVIVSWRFLFFLMGLIVLGQLNPSDSPSTDTTKFLPWERALDQFFDGFPGFYIPSVVVVLLSLYILATRLKKSDDWAETLSEHYVVNFAFGALVIVFSLLGSALFGEYYHDLQRRVPLSIYSGAFDWFLIGVYATAFALLFVVQYYGVLACFRKILR